MWRRVATAIAAASLFASLWPAFVSHAAAQQACQIERVTYRVGGRQLISWIMKPAPEGRFPVVVWSHGAKFQAAADPVINENSPCLPLVSSRGWMIFFAETRGYGGSEGPNPLSAFRADPVAFLQGRADDHNAGVGWLKTRPDVNPTCITNAGWSQGGVTVLLASARQPRAYRATVADAPGSGILLGQTLGEWTEMMRSARNIPTPILIQSNTTDGNVLVEGTRVFVRELQHWGRTVEYNEYTDPNGHMLFNLPVRPELFLVWGADVIRFLERTVPDCAR